MTKKFYNILWFDEYFMCMLEVSNTWFNATLNYIHNSWLYFHKLCHNRDLTFPLKFTFINQCNSLYFCHVWTKCNILYNGVYSYVFAVYILLDLYRCIKIISHNYICCLVPFSALIMLHKRGSIFCCHFGSVSEMEHPTQILDGYIRLI